MKEAKDLKQHFFLRRGAMYLALTIAAITFIYPFVWMIGASMASMNEISKMNLWPAHASFENYRIMAGKIPIVRSSVNSLFTALCTTVLVMITGSMAGYALARLRFQGKQLVFYILVFTMSLPFQITLIPNYI